MDNNFNNYMGMGMNGGMGNGFGGGMGMNMGGGNMGGMGGNMNPMNSMNSMGNVGGMPMGAPNPHQMAARGMGGMGMNNMGGNYDLLQQRGGGGYGMNNMNGMGAMNSMGINPSSMSSPTTPSSMGMGNMMGGPQQHPSNPMQGHSNPGMHNPPSNPGGAPNIPPAQMQQMLLQMGISVERFQAMAPHEKQMVVQRISHTVRNNPNFNNPAMANNHPQHSPSPSGMPGQGGQMGGNYFEQQHRDQGRHFQDPQRAAAMGGAGTPGIDMGLGMMGGGGGGSGMMPPPRPSTAMSNRSASGMGMPGASNMGMNNMGGMGNMSGGMGTVPGMGIGSVPNVGNNIGMPSGMGLSRPGTSMSMRPNSMSGMNMNMGSMGMNMNSMSGSNQMNHPGMGMNMPRHPSNPPGGVGTPGPSGVPGSPGPGSAGMRPPSRAMSVSSAGGGGGNDGPVVNGYPMPPSTPKHPGTPQMAHGLPQPLPSGAMPQHPQQNMHHPTPPLIGRPSSAAPGSPSLGGIPNMQRDSSMPPPVASGRGTPNPLKRKASGLESPKMGPPADIPSHNLSGPMEHPGLALQNGVSNGRAMSNDMSVGMGLTRPGPTSGISPSSVSTFGSTVPVLESTPTSTTLQTDSVPPLSSTSQKENNGDAMNVPSVNGASKQPTPTSGTPSAEMGGATATSQAAAGVNSMANGPIKVIPKLPPLPANVNLNPVVTDVKVVPLVGSDKAIPQLSQEEIQDIKRWQKVDSAYEEVFKAMRERMDLELKGDPRLNPRDPLTLLDAGEFGKLGGKAGVFGPTNIKWWEKGSISVNPGARFRPRIRETFDIRYPGKKREHGRSKKGIKREGFRIPRRLNPEEANRPEQLVPVRLEFDVDHHKYRDTFVWNLNDPVITPEMFAQTVVEDYQLAQSYHSLIVKNIQEQLSDYKAHSALYDGEGGDYLGDDNDPLFTEKGALDNDDAAWWESWRKRLRTEYGFVRKGSVKSRRKRKADGVKEELVEDADIEDADEPEERAKVLDEFEVDEGKMAEDMRVVIKLDIIVGSMKLDDQFEWDIDNVKASPEQFAEIYTQDLGLGGEFRTAIAHSIREQVQTYQKSLFLVGRPSDGPIQDEDLRSSFLPSLTEGARAMDQVQAFTPLLNYLSDGEIERNEKERDKDVTRRRKRNTRGRRGVNLPDREPIRTYRTPAIGFPELDAATLALAAAANAPVSRRAAAAAASLTIANMVASENGTPLTPLLPTAPQPVATAAPIIKEKKVKGMFKSPPVPPSVINSRAKLTTATASTAADVSDLPTSSDSISTPGRVRPVSVKKEKPTERQTKEKMFADGQHANLIDGVWHCSNCGCPESIAVGRRKGPLGDKSQCGDCGIYWHKHRRPRPCKYNTDPAYHSDLQRQGDNTKSASKKKGSASALRAHSSAVSTPAAEDISAPPTPARDRKKEGSEAPSRQSPLPPLRPPSRRAIPDDERAISPISSSSSTSEHPLSHHVQMTNGTTSGPRSPSSSSDSKPVESKKSEDSKDSNDSKDPTSSKTASPSTPPRSTVQSPPSSPTKSWPPPWLTTAMHTTQTKYPNDKFEVVLRKVGDGGSAEWRIKCVDCPGKLYKPGPGETLSNFEVHLKNRQHRQRVDERAGK